jgi:hypothetical protein
MAAAFSQIPEPGSREAIILEVVCKTAWMPSPGYLTVEEVKVKYGINPRQYPQLFQVHRNDLVSVLPNHTNIYRNHMADVRANYHALGIN